MAKFHVKLKITGFELEVDGTREEVPVIGQAIGQQLAGLLAPASQIAEGEVTSSAAINGSTVAASLEASKRTKRKNRSAPANSNAHTNGKEIAIDWIHDSAKWGSPQQGWNTADKSVWLLYAASEAANAREMNGKQIELTFNKHFRVAGPVRANNVVRDLAKLKLAGKDALVAHDTTKDPATWFLTDSGTRYVQNLITQSRNSA